MMGFGYNLELVAIALVVDGVGGNDWGLWVFFRRF